VAAALRGLSLAGFLDGRRLEEALRDYLDLPFTRHGHRGSLDRILALRSNFSAYDATYVALAKQLGAALITTDARLARGVRRHTGVGLLP
jgi:predicted nucleic acid-binding protein